MLVIFGFMFCVVVCGRVVWWVMCFYSCFCLCGKGVKGWVVRFV